MVAGKTFPAFPAHAQPVILRIWQEAHGNPSMVIMTCVNGRRYGWRDGSIDGLCMRCVSGHSVCWRFGSRVPGLESWIQQRKTAVLLFSRYHFPLASASEIIISSSSGQNGRHFADDIFKRIFLNENVRFFIKNSLKIVPKGPIDNYPE